jgi:hypothetical protein
VPCVRQSVSAGGEVKCSGGGGAGGEPVRENAGLEQLEKELLLVAQHEHRVDVPEQDFGAVDVQQVLQAHRAHLDPEVVRLASLLTLCTHARAKQHENKMRVRVCVCAVCVCVPCVCVCVSVCVRERESVGDVP